MKKLLLFSILLWQFNCELKAQAYIYHPMPYTNATWQYESSDICNSSPITWCNVDYKYYTNGIVSIAGKQYAQIYLAYSLGSCPCGVPTSNQPFSNGYVGAIRNDTANKKVYYFPSGATNELLLYDFNLTVGDTMKPRCYDSIVTIDSLIIGGNYRKRFITSQGTEFVEGIGNVGFSNGGHAEFLWGCGATLSPVTRFVCFKENATNFIKDSATCNFSLGINDTKQNTINIIVSPNPTNQKILLNTPELDVSLYEIINVLGETILKSKTTSDKTEIDLSEQQNGIHFIRVFDLDGNLGIKKIIKQ